MHGVGTVSGSAGRDSAGNEKGESPDAEGAGAMILVPVKYSDRDGFRDDNFLSVLQTNTID